MSKKDSDLFNFLVGVAADILVGNVSPDPIPHDTWTDPITGKKFQIINDPVEQDLLKTRSIDVEYRVKGDS